MLKNDELRPSPVRLEQSDFVNRNAVVSPGGVIHRGSSATRWVVIAVLLVAGIFAFVKMKQHQQAGAAQKTGAPPVPVVAGKVGSKDVPIYLDGVGSAQALNTVTIHTRVDGELIKVAFSEGQDVKVGDLLAIVDPAPYKAAFEQAKARMGQDEAQLSNAREDLARDAEMFAKKVISEQQNVTQKALVNQLEATVKADDAAVNIAQVNLGYTTITSPINGRTGIRIVDQGNIVHASDAGGLAVITTLQPIFVTFTLPEQSLAQIHSRAGSGSEALEVLAVDRDNKTVLDRGTLTVINNQIDPTTGTIELKATFPNRDLQLWPGQFVNARLHLDTRRGGLVVPASVVQRGPSGAYAFVINEDETVAIRPVKVAQIEGEEALIDEGLQAGETVVVDGQYKLQEGSHVKVAAPDKGKRDVSGK